MIRKILLLVFVSSIAVNALAEEKKKKLYKWVDEHGNVHYSDEPIKGGKEVKIPDLPTVKMKMPKLKPIISNSNGKATSQEQVANAYKSLEIVSPENEGVIRNNASQVTLTAKLDPALKQDHSLQFKLDGKLIPNPQNNLTVVIEKVAYGVHTASAVILDKNGQQLKNSKDVKFALLHIIHPDKRKKN